MRKLKAKIQRSEVSTVRGQHRGRQTDSSILERYGVMDAALGSKPSITPPLLIQSGNQDGAIGSSLSVADPSDDASRKREKGSGVWPSIVTHTWNLFSAFNPSKCMHTVVNIHLEQWAAMLRRPGSSWGFGALLKGLTSVVVPAGPEPRTHDLWVTSPTLYPLGHGCPQKEKVRRK